jgi:putative redox protein
MTVLARAVGTNTHAYVVEIDTGHHHLTADEPVQNGGQDSAPSPYGLVLSGLAACTAITMRMYAERKDWPLEQVRVDLVMHDEDAGQRIARVLTLTGGLDADQRARLLDISQRTPVTKTLRAGVRIDTRLADGAGPE